MVTVQQIQQKTTELVASQPTQRQQIQAELAEIVSEAPAPAPLFAIDLRGSGKLHVRRLDYPTAVRLTFGVLEGRSLPVLFRFYKGPSWTDPAIDLFRTTVVSADGNEYNLQSQFEFSVVITNEDMSTVAGFHLVNADIEGLYGRMMIVHPRYLGHNLGFRMLAFQAEYSSHYGTPGPFQHKKPIGLLKHKGHNEKSKLMRRLLEKIGYDQFTQDPNDPDYWRVAAKPAAILNRARELGYRETGVYF